MSVNFDLETATKEAEQKAVELTSKYGETVHAHVIVTDKQEPIVGYFKQPNRQLKMYALDMATTSLSQANDTILRTCLVEESDNRILNESPENDAIYLTFNMYASTLVEMYKLNIQKKS
jgi:hypothetical protein